MSNTTLNLSLPTQLKKKAQTEAKKRHFSSTSDYLQTLIRDDLDKIEQKNNLTSFLQKGVDSGKSKKMRISEMDEWMTGIIKNVA